MENKEHSLIIYFLFMVGLFGVCECNAKNSQSDKGKISISPTKVEVKRDSIHIDFNILVNSLVSSSTKAIKIIPYISDGSNRYDLSPIIVNGKTRAKYFRREQALSKPIYNRCYKAITQINDDQVINYKVVIPYYKWMTNAPLYVSKQQTGSKNEKEISSEKWMATCVDPSTIIPEGNEKLVKIAKKAREEQKYTLVISDKQDLSNFKTKSKTTRLFVAKGGADVFFKQGMTDISSTIEGNGEKLKMLHEIVNDSSYSIKKIRISVGCSPEGSYNRNSIIVKERSHSLKKYLCENYNLCTDSLYEEHLKIEDWDGTVLLMKDLPVPYKEEVLSIIKNVSILNGREKKIMDLHGGLSYKYLYHNIFPLLRRAEIQIDYIKREVE